jgi:LexA-binding, inner membrane-associated putative hydrolase
MKQLPALFADWANGIFAVIIAATIVGITEIPWWYFCIGILLSHLPDLDAVPELLRRGKIAASGEYVHDHREGLHYPIVFIVLGLIFIKLSAFWGWLFLIVTMLHFVNDSYGTGWGIKWLWPLTSRNFKFFNRRVNRYEWMLKRDGDWVDLSRDEINIRTIVSWSKAELPSYISRWGHDDWIEVYYYRLNAVGVIEYGLFFVSIILLIFTLL